MRSSENDDSNGQSIVSPALEEANTCENEINLIDYVAVLGKRKRFILLGSIIPTLLVGLIIFFLPRHYTTTYTYDVEDQFGGQLKGRPARPTAADINNWNLSQKNYDVFLSRFYSKENLNRIATALQQEGIGKYAEPIGWLEGLVKFEASPSYIDIDMDAVDQMNLDERELIKQLEAELLNVRITGTTPEDVPKISSVIRDNLENIIPMYTVTEQLGVSVMELRTKMANIENENYTVELVLKKNKAILGKLKRTKTEPEDKIASGVVLQFDVGGKSESLPIEYQIQTAESIVIRLEETAKDNENRYEYYEDLYGLNEKLLAHVKSRSSSAYTIQLFRDFLENLTKDVEQRKLKDYLNSYIKSIENRIDVSVPIVEDPGVYAVARGTVKKTIIVFAVFLVLTMLGAFLLEGLEKSRARA